MPRNSTAIRVRVGDDVRAVVTLYTTASDLMIDMRRAAAGVERVGGRAGTIDALVRRRLVRRHDDYPLVYLLTPLGEQVADALIERQRAKQRKFAARAEAAAARGATVTECKEWKRTWG